VWEFYLCSSTFDSSNLWLNALQFIIIWCGNSWEIQGIACTEI